MSSSSPTCSSTVGSDVPDGPIVSKFEVKLTFKDSDEKVIITDLELLKKCPLLYRSYDVALATEAEEDKLQAEKDDEIPTFYKVEGAKFLLESLPDLEHPIKMKREPEYYQKMKEMSIRELLVIRDAADFFECEDMIQCVAYALAGKVSDWTTEELGKFLNFKAGGNGKKEDEDWRLPARK